MAKNRKKKKSADDGTDASSSSSSLPSTSAAAPAAVSVPKTAADKALAAGNYSAVHHMAKQGDARAKELEPLTTIDMGQIVVGLIGMAVVLTVMFVTLHGR